MKKWIGLTLTICLLSVSTWAQTSQVWIKIAGLTCSQCSRSVEMQLRKLSFISSIEMDLQQTEARLILKNNQKIDYKAIAQAVTNSGFTVASFVATMSTTDFKQINNQCYQSKFGKFYIIESITTPLLPTIKVEFIGNAFHPKKKFNIDKTNSCFPSKPYIVHLLQ